RIESQTREWSARQSRNVQDWFRMAQLHLLMAFRSRNSFIKPYRVAPDEPYSFDEEQAEKATGYLKRIMDTPLAQREGLTPTILALDGFIRFSQGNYREAEVLFTRSLASFSSGEQKGLPRYMVMLLASRAYIQNGKLVAAQRVLSSILGDERMVPLAFPLAMEQKAEIIRLSFDGKDYKGLLSEASYRFQKESDQNGVARVHLHLAAFALEQDRPQMVRREISLASSLATGLNDWFTLGMAGYLYQTLPRD
ncbi:MAG: hypothetical protein OEW12_01260, partial [Deltaproteobacteria bacterium]|nr:hypothetical protein [Deltaproteobacteria bacterium]